MTTLCSLVHAGLILLVKVPDDATRHEKQAAIGASIRVLRQASLDLDGWTPAGTIGDTVTVEIPRT